MRLDYTRCILSFEYTDSEWASSFLTAQQYILRYLVPYGDAESG